LKNNISPRNKPLSADYLSLVWGITMPWQMSDDT